MQSVPVMVIGGGASGMMAAIAAAKNGSKVLLIEKLNRLGKKLLATGNGRCNFTNSYQETECYRGEESAMIQEALQLFSWENTLEFFWDAGIFTQAKDGYYYPASGQASSILEALLRQLKQYKVRIQMEEKVLSIEPSSRGYIVTTDQGKYQAAQVILSVGGKASPVHGTTGDGYGIAAGMGLSVIPPLPALTSCVLKGDFMKGWSGVRVKGQVSLYEQNGHLLAKDSGELQMVAYGISGIPVFQISRFAARSLEQGQKPYLLMDIMTEYSEEYLVQELQERKSRFGSWNALDALDGMMHRKLAQVLLESLGMNPKESISQWSDKNMEKIAGRMKGWKLGIAAVSDFDKAQVTCGGVSLSQLNPKTMEVNQYPGLYLTGELLDVDGICGGYNLQWAWTSGYLAGKAAAENGGRQGGR